MPGGRIIQYARFGLEHFSEGYRAWALARWGHSVTWPNGFRLTAGTGTGPAFRFQPGPEVPDDHCHPIHRARHDPARLHRSRTARPRRVPGRIPRPDPRGVRAGPA